MRISAAHSFLVHAAKHLDPVPPASGTALPMEGRLFGMIQELCDRSPVECGIEIVFRPGPDGTLDSNSAQSELQSYAEDPCLETASAIAQRLQAVTTNKSGLGLLFLANGKMADDRSTLVISRFPADQGVVAEERATRLEVEFIERVFMKNTRAYKSALYRTSSPTAEFQEGLVVDRQLTGPSEVSQYWIFDFLMSELRTTGPFGSRRLADAVRSAVNRTDNPRLKHELVSASQMVRNLDGTVASSVTLLEKVGTSRQAIESVESSFQRRVLARQEFRFDAGEFAKRISYRMVELSNGAMLLADDTDFDDVFQVDPTDVENVFRYATEGEVVDQRYRLRK